MQLVNKQFDVVIVGAGPVGLVAANLLGLYQIKTLVLEKHTHPFSYPRAVAIDDEALRTLKLCGFLQTEIDSLVTPARVEYFMLDGYRYFDPDPTIKPYGHPVYSSFLQPNLEKILRQKIHTHRSVTLMPDCEFQEYAQHIGEPLHITFVAKNQDLQCITSQFLLGCDGAHSAVRSCAHFTLQGSTQRHKWLVLDVIDSKAIQEKLLFLQTMMKRKEAFVTINLPEGLRRIEIQLRDTDAVSLEQFTKQHMMAVLGRYFNGIEMTIIRHQIYARHYRIINQFNEKNVFFLGDAAHLIPPTGGQGMCTGIADAANLCWKLAAVLHGRVDESLLASYATERRQGIERVIQFVKKISTLSIKKSNKPENGCHITTRRYLALKKTPHYNTGFFYPSKFAGHFLPQPWIKALDGRKVLLDVLLGKTFIIIGIDLPSEEVFSQELKTFWKKMGGHFLMLNTQKYRSCALAPHHVVLDEHVAMFDDLDHNVLFVRPDRFILGSCHHEEISTLIAAGL